MLNADKPHLWKQDVIASVQQYNEWFVRAAPTAYRDTRANVVDEVERAMSLTSDMRSITPQVLRGSPGILGILRMSTAPPIARDRLVGLAYSTKPLVQTMEDKGILPPRMTSALLDEHLDRICGVLNELLDSDLFDWLASPQSPTAEQRQLAAVVVGDRRCGALADPIVRNAQEARQLALMQDWLEQRGYVKRTHPGSSPITSMPAGTFSFRQNVPVLKEDGSSTNMPIDAVIQPSGARPGAFPLLVEAKSAGDFTNTNKRRKEEATKIRQLRATYGKHAGLLLFLCGYFDAGYLGYEAAEGLDWVWEHRIDDLANAGI